MATFPFLTDREQRKLEREKLVDAEPEKRPVWAPDWLLAWFGRRPILAASALALAAEFAHHHTDDPSAFLLRPDHGLAWLLCVVGLVGVVAAFIDIATYRPRLFVRAEPGEEAEAFFSALAAVSDDFAVAYNEINDSPAATWRDAAEHEDSLIKEANHYYVLDRVRMGVTRQVVYKLAIIVLALSLTAFGLDGVTHGHFLRGLPPHPEFLQFVYFTVTCFFTVGFGDITPLHPWGYLFMSTCVAVLVLTTYFILAEVAASYVAFDTNVRDSARRFVASRAVF